MKIVVSEFVTLDGVMEAPGMVEGFDRAGWNLPYMDEQAGKYKYEELLAADGLLLGGVTYRSFAESWPSANMGDLSDQMNNLAKYVVSPDLTTKELTWNNTHQIKDNVIDEITKLRQQPGKDLLVYGSGVLVQTLVQNNLVDEYRLMVHPVILGAGKRLFEEGLDKKELSLVSTKSFPKGVVVLTYTAKQDNK